MLAALAYGSIAEPPGRRPRPPDRPRGSRRRQGRRSARRDSGRRSRSRAGRSAAGALRAPLRPRPGPGEHRRSSSTGASPRAPSRPASAGCCPRERLEEVATAGTTFRTLPADVLLVALCVHGAKHVWERLGWIVDVAELIAAAPGARLGRGARPRRRGRPHAGAPSRLPPGAGPPGHGLPEDPVTPHRRRSEASGAGAHGSRPARPARRTDTSGSPRRRGSTSGSAERGATVSPTSGSR